MEITSLSQLDPNKTYTYSDYLLWKLKERIELFKGKIFKMSPAPARIHQKISLNITIILEGFFRNNPCELYVAPFDVRIPDKDGKILTVVQPDLCVICDMAKLDERGCLGAPDLIVEILSPGNTKKELDLKFRTYEEAGVLEYWLVHPTDKYIQIFILEEGKYIGLKPFTEDEVATSKIFPDLSFPTAEVFENL